MLVVPLYAFMPHTLGQAWNGNVEAVSTAFLPRWGAALIGVVHRPDRARIAAAAVCLLLLIWSDQYRALAMALTSPLLLVIALWQHRSDRRRRLGAVALAVASGVLLSGLGPAVGLPDHTLVVTLNPHARAAVEARARAHRRTAGPMRASISAPRPPPGR
ncbi:MAG: hypothetical protein D6798_06295 [Deltaproteobacteria bacterium]|nr:MAG: hypothetical protein D6798_06295 [Deltaproteobacteria bacterium]